MRVSSHGGGGNGSGDSGYDGGGDGGAADDDGGGSDGGSGRGGKASMPGSRPRAFVGDAPRASGMRAQRKRVGSAVQFDRRATQSRGLLRAPGCLGEVLGTRAREPWHAPTGLVGCCSKVPKQSVRLRPVSAASQRARILTAGCTCLQDSRMACAFIEHGPHTPHRPWELPSKSMVRTCCSSHVCFPAACLLALSALNRVCILRSAGLKDG